MPDTLDFSVCAFVKHFFGPLLNIFEHFDIVKSQKMEN